MSNDLVYKVGSKRGEIRGRGRGYSPTIITRFILHPSSSILRYSSYSKFFGPVAEVAPKHGLHFVSSPLVSLETSAVATEEEGLEGISIA